MGSISHGIRTIAERRADIFRKVEKITCETTEASVDDAVKAATVCVRGDLDEKSPSVDIDGLLAILPDMEDDTREKEIANILASQEDVIGLDDLLGIDEDDDFGDLI